MGENPFSNSALLRFDTRLHRTISYVSPLPLKEEVFLICRHLHVVRDRGGSKFRAGQHQEIEIQYLLEGESLYETAQDQRTLHPGEGILIMAGLRHWSLCVQESVRLTGRVAINGPQADQLIKDLVAQTNGELSPVGGTTEDTLICELFKLALDPRPKIWQREMIGGLVQAWLGTVLATCLDFTSWTRQVEENSGIARDRSTAMCERANEFIYAHFHHAISVGDIAQHVGITQRHLNRLFCQHFDTSVKVTLQNVRLTEAFKMLNSDPMLPIKEVAYAVGFTSPSYFTQCFKRKYNMLPNEVSRGLSSYFEDALNRFMPAAQSNLERNDDS